MRKESIIKLQDFERVLTFKVRQMPAWDGFCWAEKAALAIGKSPNFFSLLTGEDPNQRLGAIITAICSGLKFEEADPLQRELLSHCSRIDAGIEQVCTPESINGFVENPYVIAQLLTEAITVNVSFFLNASPLNSVNSDATSSESSKKPAQSPIRMSAG